jgi:3-hydroxy acid dehydrogenase/malonic semialdehyde reductase
MARAVAPRDLALSAATPRPLDATRYEGVAFITGASSGMGAATARRFARAGAQVVLAARRRERLEALALELGPNAHPLELDVRDRTAVERAVESLPAKFSAISLLLNNAGLALGLEPAQEANAEAWDTMVDTNIKGVLHLTRTVLPGMVARERGHVVNIGSVAASAPYPGGNVYGATKAFVSQLSQNLRADLLGHRVRVTDIEPGMVETEFSLVRFGGDDKRAAGVYRDFQPLTAEDIAEAIFWCATLPEHVDVSRLEIYPVMQAHAGFSVHRGR